MTSLLQTLKIEINNWVDNLSKRDLEDFEYGKPFHITCEEDGKLLRAVLFLEQN